MRARTPLGIVWSVSLALGALLSAPTALAHGGFPEPRQILLPQDRPGQIILATNFGLIFSEDAGGSWLFSCESGISAYAAPYLLAAPPQHRLFGMTAGGVIYSDDDSCTWTAAGGSLTDIQPFAFTVDTSNSKRVYAIGAPREDLGAGDSIYVSDDAGRTFGEPTFTAPPGSALLTLAVAPSRPSTLFATLLSLPEYHPVLLRSRDAGEHWEVVADLVESIGASPFELLAVDPSDENKLYVKILGASAETLGISDDGGLSFVQPVSIPGKLNAFLKLASGTLLVGGTAGTDAVAYRSTDGAQTFEPWPDAPHIHALAERDGKLYIGADNFADGYAIAVSEDEGAHLTPLMAFDQVQGVRSCLADACAESCAYFVGIKMWPDTVCAAPPDEPVPGDGSGGDNSGGDASGGEAGLAGAEGNDEPPTPRPASGGGGCSCTLVANWRPASLWLSLLILGHLALLVGRRRAGRASSRPD